jgi:radical SAM superfamily enzyme YgiQ (UPF0313 family)
MGRCKVALVGADEQENLSLAFLAAAAEAAGHEVHLVRFNNRRDLDSCARAVVELAPDLVGLSIPFQYAIADSLALAERLRADGFGGQLTCGGHVPTFCHRELLRDGPALDTVVRHEGEETLVEICDRVGAGLPVRGLRGLVWREGDRIAAGPIRPPVRDLDRLPWPRRGEPMLVGGVPIAFLLTSRGCVGDCSYCCIRAFGRSAGGPAFRLRSPESVADEVADLYHRMRVRLFFVQDDLFILPSQRKTVARMDQSRRRLAERGVTDAAFWIKGRPESMTAAMVAAARRMGAIHVFLGVENACGDRLAYLGRNHTSQDNRDAIQRCLDAGIRPSFNLMMFDPDTSLADVAANIDFAEACLPLQWNVCRTEIYSGTRLLDRLRDQGRLEGDYRGYGYVMRDLRAEIMFRVMRVAFDERCFAHESLMNKMIALSFARQVHQRFFPGPASDSLARQADELIVDVHRDTVDELRRVLAFAARVDLRDERSIRGYAVELGLELTARAQVWHERFDSLWRVYNARGATRFQQLVPCPGELRHTG